MSKYKPGCLFKTAFAKKGFCAAQPIMRDKTEKLNICHQLIDGVGIWAISEGEFPPRSAEGR
jgi:hypothetical protein